MDKKDWDIFTFQYGQIRKILSSNQRITKVQIYIPVWLDQKDDYLDKELNKKSDLHSSMVRLESFIFNFILSKFI